MRALHLGTLALVATVIAACEGTNLFGDNAVATDGPGSEFEAVILEFENEAGETIDLIEQGGRFDLLLNEETGEFESNLVFDQLNIEVDGDFEIEDGALIFSDDPFADDDAIIERRFELVDAGDVIFLSDPAAAWDVDGDGFVEVAELEIRLERR